MVHGLEPGKVRVVPYDPAWAERYAAEARRLRRAIGELIEDVEHIGSTAVPGVSAKPIIDVAVGVADVGAVESLIAPLAGLGYEYRGLLFGQVGHHFFGRGDPRRFYLHVFARGGALWRERIAFRDYLIAHPNVAAEYRELKGRLAGEHPDDRAAYTAAKAAFINQVTRTACGRQADGGGDRR